MNISYPHTIENGLGEKIIFTGLHHEADGDRLVAENFVTPGNGPLMHTHWLQDEGFTVISGRIGYQVEGEAEQFAGKGESVIFERGVPHRFWNAGQEILHCQGWVKPANSFPFFLSSIFAAQVKSGKSQPAAFDAAYLLTRYSTEYDISIPKFVRKVIIPFTYFLGRLLGKYRHFKNAPAPIRN